MQAKILTWNIFENNFLSTFHTLVDRAGNVNKDGSVSELI